MRMCSLVMGATLMVDEALQVCTGNLLHDLLPNSAEEKVRLLDVWDHARRYVRYIVELKFSIWTKLPWVLCGAGHRDEEKARQCLARARSEWLASEAHDHHEVFTMSVMGDEHLFEEICAFVDGTMPRAELPRLARLGLKLRMVRVCEVSVERLHRMASLALEHAPNAMGPYISMFSGRREELVLHVLGDKSIEEHRPIIGDAFALAAHIDRCRNPGLLIKEFGLQHHPSWLLAPTDKKERGKRWRENMAHKEAAAIFYRYDQHSMFDEREAMSKLVDAGIEMRRTSGARSLLTARCGCSTRWRHRI